MYEYLSSIEITTFVSIIASVSVIYEESFYVPIFLSGTLWTLSLDLFQRGVMYMIVPILLFIIWFSFCFCNKWIRSYCLIMLLNICFIAYADWKRIEGLV